MVCHASIQCVEWAQVYSKSIQTGQDSAILFHRLCFETPTDDEVTESDSDDEF